MWCRNGVRGNSRKAVWSQRMRRNSDHSKIQQLDPPTKPQPAAPIRILKVKWH